MQDPMWDIEQVDDWDDRIKDYPDHIKKFYDKMIPKI